MYTVYYKPECPWSQKALKFLDSNGLKYSKFNVHDFGGKDRVAMVLYNAKYLPKYKNLTVPIVFKSKKYIGGCTELINTN
jgi:glutaredoxin